MPYLQQQETIEMSPSTELACTSSEQLPTAPLQTKLNCLQCRFAKALYVDIRLNVSKLSQQGLAKKGPPGLE